MCRLVLAIVFALGCSASTSAPPFATTDADEDSTMEEDTIASEEDTATDPEDTGSVADTRKTDTKPPPSCIAVGSSTVCGSYSDCCDDGECVSTPTKTAHCCWTRLQAVTCTKNEQCCDDWCTAGKCCVPPGKKCSINSMCCSNWCGSQMAGGVDGGVTLSSSVCCVRAGATCATNDDCCTRSCVSGKCACLAAGAAVPAFGQELCCSGTYAMAEAGVGYRCR